MSKDATAGLRPTRKRSRQHHVTVVFEFAGDSEIGGLFDAILGVYARRL